MNYFKIIKAALGEEVGELGEIKLEALFEFAKNQALLGLLYPIAEKTQGNKVIIFQWFALKNAINKRNEQLNHVIENLLARTKSDGWDCYVLKGQSNAKLYPDPLSRNPGDIDLWFRRKEGVTLKQHRQMVKAEVEQWEKENGAQKSNEDISSFVYHHMDAEYMGVEVEAHFTPSWMSNPLYNKRLQKWFTQVPITKCEQQDEIEFNLVYQLIHIYRHFFDAGIGLRQIVDYYILLSRWQVAGGRSQLAKRMGRFGLSKFASALMWIMQECFELPAEKLIVKPDEWRGKLLLAEILRGGNFGTHDTRWGSISQMSKPKKFWTRIRRNWDFFFMYPTEAVADPTWRASHVLTRKLHLL